MKREPLTDKQKLAYIKRVYATVRQTKGTYVTSHARLNLEGALHDMNRTGKADCVSLRTLCRVARQLARIERVLGL